MTWIVGMTQGEKVRKQAKIRNWGYKIPEQQSYIKCTQINKKGQAKIICGKTISLAYSSPQYIKKWAFRYYTDAL